MTAVIQFKTAFGSIRVIASERPADSKISRGRAVKFRICVPRFRSGLLRPITAYYGQRNAKSHRNVWIGPSTLDQVRPTGTYPELLGPKECENPTETSVLRCFPFGIFSRLSRITAIASNRM